MAPVEAASIHRATAGRLPAVTPSTVSVATDRTDYSPGDPVTVTVTGLAPGQFVQLAAGRFASPKQTVTSAVPFPALSIADTAGVVMVTTTVPAGVPNGAQYLTVNQVSLDQTGVLRLGALVGSGFFETFGGGIRTPAIRLGVDGECAIGARVDEVEAAPTSAAPGTTSEPAPQTASAAAVTVEIEGGYLPASGTVSAAWDDGAPLDVTPGTDGGLIMPATTATNDAGYFDVTVALPVVVDPGPHRIALSTPGLVEPLICEITVEDGAGGSRSVVSVRHTGAGQTATEDPSVDSPADETSTVATTSGLTAASTTTAPELSTAPGTGHATSTPEAATPSVSVTGPSTTAPTGTTPTPASSGAPTASTPGSETHVPGAGTGTTAATDPTSVGAPAFSWTIAGTDHAVTLAEAQNKGAYLQATGQLIPVTVDDTRDGGPSWSISAQLSDFDSTSSTTSSGALPGRYLGWTPQVIAPGAGAAAGPAVAPGLTSGPGLTDPAVLASAADGHPAGSATVGADLDLLLPAATPPGSYTATLTLTALS